MPVEVRHSPPPLHQPGGVTRRPKGILKNPSFSDPSGPGSSQASPPKSDPQTPAANHISENATSPLFSAELSKEITLQNTLQNAGHRRSSSAAGRASSNSRRQSSVHGGSMDEDDPEGMRLKWDEANLYLAEQGRGTRMKITEPKTPFQYGNEGTLDEAGEEEDVGIDPRFVNVDEVEMARAKRASGGKKSRDSEIAPLELGEPEEDVSAGVDDAETARIVRADNLSREGSREKHVSVSSADVEGMNDVDSEKPGMPTSEEMEKHRQFEERRKKHYEMKSVKGLLGNFDEMDEEDDSLDPTSTTLPDRGMNGA